MISGLYRIHTKCLIGRTGYVVNNSIEVVIELRRTIIMRMEYRTTESIITVGMGIS